MSQVISSFRSAVGTAVGAPFHAVLVFLTTLLGVVVGGVLGFIPLFGPLVNGVVVAPALLVAAVGSAHAVRNGDGAFGGAKSAVKRAGASVMGAYALLTAIYVGVSLVLTLLFAVLLFAMGVGSGIQSGNGLPALTGAVGVVGVLLFLIFLVVLLAVAMAVQFVAPAAVVAGTGALDSLKTSYRFFHRNVLGVTGFSLLLAAVGAVAMLAVAVLFAIGRAIDPGVGLALAAIGYVVAIAAVGSVTSIYQVSYFDSVVESAALPDGHDWEDSGDDTGEFVVGDVSQAAVGSEAKPTSESGGFHVEMSGENDATDESGQTADTPDDSANENAGWDTDPTDRDG